MSGLFREDQLRELAELLGSDGAARRINDACAALVNAFGAPQDIPGKPPGLRPALVRKQAETLARASAAMLDSMAAMSPCVLGPMFGARCRGEDTAPWASLTHPDTVTLGDFSKGGGSDEWVRLMADIRLLAVCATELAAREVPRGRTTPIGMTMWGRTFRDWLEGEGIARSSAIRSQMVRAFELLFQALGIKQNAREFVRTLNEDRVR